MNAGTRRVTVIVGAAALLAAALFPVMSSDAYWYTVIATALVYGALALSLDLLWGHSGVLNLAPALAFGLGAYAWGIVTGEVDGITGTYLAIAAAILVPAIFSGLVALVSFKAGTREIYFALITLATLLVLQQVAESSTDLTGGSNGLIGIEYPTLGIPGVWEVTLESPDSLYYLAWAVAAIAFAFSVWLVWSRVGTVLAAVRESDLRADTLGYSTLRYRVMISAISAGIAGLAGMAYAPITGIVDPAVLGVALSVQVFVWVAVGGSGSLIGPMIAAIGLSIGQSELTGSSASAYLLGTGVVFILIVLFLPGGLASALKYARRPFGGSGPGLKGPAPATEGRK
jgi:ABC-type branched-subunit amino acid transport system permease subunit